MSMKNQNDYIVEQQYNMHDCGEQYVTDLFNSYGMNPKQEGYDSREDEETRGNIHVDGKGENYNDLPDIYIPDLDVWIDIKTTSKTQYLGNLRDKHLERYEEMIDDGETVLIFCAVVREKDETTEIYDEEMGWYNVEEVEIVGSNTNRYGQTYLEPNEDDIKDFEELAKQLFTGNIINKIHE